MNLPKVDPKNAKGLLILVGGLIAIIIVAVYINKTFGGIAKMFQDLGSALGLADTPEQAAQKKAIADAKAAANNTASPWSPIYWQNAPTGARLITSAGANDFAEKIWDSVGIFTSSITDVVGVIHQLSAKSQVSFLADMFYKNYNKDLLAWLTLQYTKMGTPDPALADITTYVNNLQPY